MIRTDWLEKWALYTPEKTAFLDASTGKSYNYMQFYKTVNKLAHVFISEYKISHGERVAVLSQNNIEYIFVYFALQKLGAILTPLNFRLAGREIEYIINDCEPKLIIYQNEYKNVLDSMNINKSIIKISFSSKEENDIKGIIENENELPLIETKLDFKDPSMILYTSGTTGKPKGAIITHEMIFWNSINTTMRLNLTSEDVTPTFAPFFHTGGWHVLMTPFLHRGAKQILLNSFNPDLILRLCDEEKVTILFGVPTMMKMMADSKIFNEVTLDTVRFAIVGGEPMPKPMINLWNEKGVPIRQGYGLTEVGPNCFSLPEKDAVRKIGSIGFPNFYVDIKIVDDNNKEVKTNEAGELLLKGPMVTPGYWRNAKATAESIENGWFHTGDIVRKDEDGYVYVVDRKKDMFISGAENVYPAEIEKFLYTNPRIAEAAVIGTPDDKWGEVGKAFIVLKKNEQMTKEEILEFCKGNLAKYKIPKYFEFIEELPKGHSGKIFKRALKENK